MASQAKGDPPAIRPPNLIEIYSDVLQPGRDKAYITIERAAAQMCARLGCPNPYVTLQSVNGPDEVWFVNGFASASDAERVAAGYRSNLPLLRALDRVLKSKANLVGPPAIILARYRPELSLGPKLGQPPRFLLIRSFRDAAEIPNAYAPRYVYEVTSKTRTGSLLVIVPLRSLRSLATGGQIYGFRPMMSFVDRAWVLSDPGFWAPASRFRGP